MKINLKCRLKNIYWWIGIVGVILTAMGVDAETLTSWTAVYDAIIELVSNPFMLGSVFMAIVGVLVDPTTANLQDSDIAMTYTEPRKNEDYTITNVKY